MEKAPLLHVATDLIWELLAYMGHKGLHLHSSVLQDNGLIEGGCAVRSRSEPLSA